MNKYDYIITGAGCAGLSLLMRMMQHAFFHDKKILVVDQLEKKSNDKTWCYWETKPGLFDPIVYHRWKQLDFYSNSYSARFTIEPYEYKMIRSIDFYDYVLKTAETHQNIEFKYGAVSSISAQENCATLMMNDEQFQATYIFNSIIFNQAVSAVKKSKNVYHLLQHFKGWYIQTDKNTFDDEVATFMDFRVSQQHGTTFMYVLPTSSKTALIEYTLFSENLLPGKEYENALKEYLNTILDADNYTILHEEFGVIPMTNKEFPSYDKNIVNIGTAGGQTKPSSGYTFQFIQKQTEKIILLLLEEKSPEVNSTLNKKKFDVYDSALLNVLQNKKMGGADIFSDIFQKNPPQRVLKFLDNETNLAEDLKILASVPAKAFFPAALKELYNSISG